MPWFDELCGAYGLGAFWAENRATSALLGFINLLGAYGNHVFFLISGMFLVPAAARAASLAAADAAESAADLPGGAGAGSSVREAYWFPQLRRAARRGGALLATVALWLAVAVAASPWVPGLDASELLSPSWLAGGLEFIWVYLAFTLAAPAVGWAWSRLRKPQVAASLLCAAVMAVNAWIAFVSPGEAERSLLDWRKLMSAVTYFSAFLAGGALADARWPRRRAAALLAGVVATCLGTEAACSWAGRLDLMAATSFKSTSLLSFALAAASLLFVRSRKEGHAGSGGADAGTSGADAGTSGPDATPDTKKPAQLDAPASRAGRLAGRLAKSVLSFYVLQSITFDAWQGLFFELTSQAFLLWNSWAVLALGCGLSLGLLAALIVLDQLTRLPLFRRLGLA